MKKRLLIFILCVIGVVCGGLALAACSTPALPAPEYLRVESSDSGDVLRWKEVDGADSYVVEIDGDSKTTRRTEFSLSRFELDAGDHEVNVKACSEDGNESPWATVSYFVPDMTGIIYTALDENSYYVSGVGKATGVIVVDDEYLGLPVVAIGQDAFIGAAAVTEVILGKNVTAIGSRAFYNCIALKSVTVTGKLNAIGTSAFQSCLELEEFVVHGTVQEIGSSAFAYCSKLKSVTLEEGIKIIGVGAFQSCTSLTEITTPSTTEIIGNLAFCNCRSLKKATVNGNKLVIYPRAFEFCGAVIDEVNTLEQNELIVKLGNVETIYSSAFHGCSALKAIDIPDSVIDLDARVFKDCVNLSDVTIGLGVTELGNELFDNTAIYNNAVNYVVVGDWFVKLKNKDYTVGDFRKEKWRGIAGFAFQNSSLQSAYQLPESLEYIGVGAFYNCSVSSVTIGDNVKVIGDRAFMKCENLRSVAIGNSVEDIGAGAFFGCKVLTPVNTSGGKNINFPSSVKHVGMQVFDETAFSENSDDIMVVDGWVVGCNEDAGGNLEIPAGVIGIADFAFYGCLAISRIYIPDTVTIIGEGAFAGCGIQTIELPANLEEIKPLTFYLCQYLQTVTIPNGVKTIGEHAFRSCLSLIFVDIPDSVQTIGEAAFSFCDNLSSVTLGNYVSEIGEYAFAYCVSLKDIALPNSLKTINDYAFYRCSALSSIDFGNGVQRIGNRAFYQCTMLSTLDMPDSIISIGEYAFYRCLALWKVRIGENVTSIAEGAFYGCENLLKIEIPDAVESIGSYAFMDCFKLASVNIGANLTTIGNHVFMNCDSLTIYTEANNKYSGWGEYWNSQYRPVIYGCNLSAYKDYVESVKISATTIANGNAKFGVVAPQRLGFTFVGWATTPNGNVVYSAARIVDVQDDVTLYAVWEETEEAPNIKVRPEYEPGWDREESNEDDWMKPLSDLDVIA